MKEQEQLTKLFNDLFEGSPWIDVNISSTLNELTAKEAATKAFPNFNSVWEIVNHMINWRETVLKRMQGQIVESPEDNYFSSIRDRSENAWQITKEHFRESQHRWLRALENITRKDLTKTMGDGPFTHYDLVFGILQHDSYHLGQIRLIKKLVQLT